MSTALTLRSVAALLAALVLLPAAQPAAAASTCGGSRALLSAGAPASLATRRSRGEEAPLAPAYGWPVKPFDRPHPVRANLDDPRVGHHGGESFHFGIDIAVPDGTPVYAVAPGIAYVRPGSVAVAAGPRTAFGYWHVRAVVATHARIRLHQLLGYVIPGWEHVHFAERRDGVYLNPLRPGALGPYVDTTVPTVAEIAVASTSSGVELLANAYDLPALPVPGEWADEPVSPALLRWRLLEDGRPAGAWHTTADFRTRLLDARRFREVYAPATRQNHKGAAGAYCFVLARSWRPPRGRYTIEVAASDVRGNLAVARAVVR